MTRPAPGHKLVRLLGKVLMPPFCIGDLVLIRRGDRAGQRAEVVQAQPAEVYKVKMRDGSFLFYSERQLDGIHRQAPDPSVIDSIGKALKAP